MKKFFIFAIMAIFIAKPSEAQKLDYLEEIKYLGAVAGQGLACDAAKYQTYELLARAILISKAKSDKQQSEGMKTYNEMKAFAFISTINDSSNNCEQINEIFNNQLIFKSTLYGDGTIKMSDGQIITPRHPYDATLVYKKDTDTRKKYLEMYNAQKQKIQNDPVYQRALREQQQKHRF